MLHITAPCGGRSGSLLAHRPPFLPSDRAGAKQSGCIPTFHPNTESRHSRGRQQDPGAKQYSGSDCVNTVSIKSVLFAFAAVPRVSENLTVPGTVQVQNKLTPI